MATTTPNFGWPVPTSTDLVKDGATAMEALGDAIDTSMVDLKGGTTGQVLAKASNTDMDFSWVAQDDSNAIQNTIVDAKGDLIAASAADTPARLAVGNNGEILVPDSSTSTGLRYQAIQTRNCVYNSSFEIAQRGTSFTANGYTFDRWYLVTAGVAGRTLSRISGSGQFQYLARIQRTAGNTATNGVDFGQSFEIADSTPYAGKTVTVSFYARKGADFSGTFSFFVFSGTSSTETNRVTTAYPSGAATPLNTGAIALTTTLTRYQYTFTFGDTVTQFCILPSLGFTGTAGAADLVDFGGFKIEVGSVATDYVRQGENIQQELAACQRYYERLTSESYYGLFGSALTNNSTTATAFMPFKVTKRTTPTAIDTSAVGLWQLDDGVAGYTASAIVISSAYNDTQWGSVTVTSSGMTQYRNCVLVSKNSQTAYIGFSAEL